MEFKSTFILPVYNLCNLHKKGLLTFKINNVRTGLQKIIFEGGKRAVFIEA